MNWTPQQKAAITERGKNLIVSAAAGSGKTAVLANRAAEYIINGGSCERLLVVTFTRLAAAEMRERIIGILDDIPSPDEHITEQKLLLNSARISTIDSYFGELVRKNFKDLGIAPDYGYIDSAEYDYIKAKAVTEVTDEYRSTYKNGYEELERIFGGEINDDSLNGTIDRLYSFMQTEPFGEKWAELCEKRYDSPEFWTDAVCGEIRLTLADFISVYKEVTDARPFKDAGMEIVAEEYAALLKTDKAAAEKRWDICREAAGGYEFQRSPSCAKDSRVMQKYKHFRAELKDFFGNELFMINPEEAAEDARYLKGAVRCLFLMVKDYGGKILSEMKKRGSFSFDEVSKMALSLVVSDYDAETGSFTKTELAEKTAGEFDEILIDEYQDVNDLQDLFFSAISNGNLFCVGDVKQSIYRFRHANPRNFTKKRGSFMNIPLNMNFRSRKGILGFCNFVFSQLFSEEVGDTAYDETERLNPGAVYPDADTPEVEIKYLRYLRSSEEENSAVQARYAAREIKRLISSGIEISGKNSLRPVNFGDFAVLLRKFANTSDIYERVFYEEGIPCYSKSGGSFLDSVEVNTVLAYLKIIDNPYDDAAMFAVMYSRLFGFTPDKISHLRTGTKKGRNLRGRLYDALKELAENDSEFKAFYDGLTRFRLRSLGFPVHTLIWDIYTETSYPTKVLSLSLGSVRRDRLMAFFAFARSYGDRIGGGTLGGFIDFAESAIATGQTDKTESLPSGNFVKLLTIHASKGLEFPVCIVPELEKRLDPKELRDTILIDGDLGIAADRFSEGFEYKQTTFMKELLKLRIRRAEMSEALRLLYVAFTRAKEKLILISSGNTAADEKLVSYALLSYGNAIYRSEVCGASSFEELLTATVCRHPSAKALHSDFCDVLTAEDTLSAEIIENEPEQESEDCGKAARFPAAIRLTEEELDRRFAKRGDISDYRLPAKVSVTEIAKEPLPDPEAEQLFGHEYSYKKPSFLCGGTLKGAGKGSAVHLYMQLCDLNADIVTEAERLKNEGLLTEEEYAAVLSEKQKIKNFEKSDLYAEIMSAAVIRREESFVSYVPASVYDGKEHGGAKILIQGSIDMLCEYPDGFVIIDYKTDSLNADELRARYSRQLGLYRDAVNGSYGKPVKKCVIWSFKLSEAVEITD